MLCPLLIQVIHESRAAGQVWCSERRVHNYSAVITPFIHLSGTFKFLYDGKRIQPTDTPDEVRIGARTWRVFYAYVVP
jgi:hypothetical protein